VDPDNIENTILRIFMKWVGWIALLVIIALVFAAMLAPLLAAVFWGPPWVIILGGCGTIALFILMLVIVEDLDDV
jgi:hypothetical protein